MFTFSLLIKLVCGISLFILLFIEVDLFLLFLSVVFLYRLMLVLFCFSLSMSFSLFILLNFCLTNLNLFLASLFLIIFQISQNLKRVSMEPLNFRCKILLKFIPYFIFVIFLCDKQPYF